MSVWDVFTGKKSSKPSTEIITSTPTTNFSAPFDPSSAQDVSSFLGSASLPDASQLHPLAGLNQQTLDYLSLDESTLSDLPGSRSALPSRGWSDDLCYGTGVTYLTALSMGGAWGLIEGLNRTPASAPPKLRLNSVLNSVTRRGPFLGNSAGVVAMVYNGFNSIIGHYRGKHDSANSIVAGALSGMLFKSTRGLKPMVISGGIVATVAGTWAVRIMTIRFRWENADTDDPGHQKSTLLSSRCCARSTLVLALPQEPGRFTRALQFQRQDCKRAGLQSFSGLPSFAFLDHLCS